MGSFENTSDGRLCSSGLFRRLANELNAYELVAILLKNGAGEGFTSDDEQTIAHVWPVSNFRWRSAMAWLMKPHTFLLLKGAILC